MNPYSVSRPGHSVLNHSEPLVDLWVDRSRDWTEWWFQLGNNKAFIVFTELNTYFRVLGWGLACRRGVRGKPTFSERFGFKHVWRVGGWVFEVLKPDKWVKTCQMERCCMAEYKGGLCKFHHVAIMEQMLGRSYRGGKRLS
jgi:hypothetical protein